MVKSYKEKKMEKEQSSKEKSNKNINPVSKSLLPTDESKTERIVFRVTPSVKKQFVAINKKRGASDTSILNLLVGQYINENKNLLN